MPLTPDTRPTEATSLPHPGVAALAQSAGFGVPAPTPPAEPGVADLHRAALLKPTAAAATDIAAELRLIVRDIANARALDRRMLLDELVRLLRADAALDDAAWSDLADEGLLPGA